MGARDKTRAAGDKPKNVISLFVGWCASELVESATSVEIEDGAPSNTEDTGC